jgi:hypothetical protein
MIKLPSQARGRQLSVSRSAPTGPSCKYSALLVDSFDSVTNAVDLAVGFYTLGYTTHRGLTMLERRN